MKKIIISLIVVVIIIVLAFLGWYFFVRDQSVPLTDIISGAAPFGSGDDLQPTTDNQQLTTNTVGDGGDSFMSTDEFGSPTASLFRISNTPVAGFIILNNSSSSAFVRYVDRATGHILDIDLATLEKTKVANQTIPKVYEAYFRSDGLAVLVRTLKDDTDVVENLSLSLAPPQAGEDLYTISSTIIRGDIGSIAVGSNDTIFYALRDTTSIVSSAFSGGGFKTLYTSPFTNWGLSASGGALVIYTKASATVGGYVYTLDGGSLVKIIGPMNGLVVTPNSSGTKVLLSYADGPQTKMLIKNLKDNSLYEISPASLAEKCVWGRKNTSLIFCGSPSTDIGSNEPDGWYKGVTSFSDRVWLFDTVKETSQVLVEPEVLLGVGVDVISPQLSPNEDYLVFINKTDLSLWVLKLESF